MILVAPDKFKGTLTARQAAEAMAEGACPRPCLLRPMADGGEGTAEILCAGPGWERREGYYYEPATRTAVLDSSAFIGFEALYGRPVADATGAVWQPALDIMHASSRPLGVRVRQLVDDGCRRVVIGIGGTATCDGGEGFLQALGVDDLERYRDIIVGLSDVRVPLVAPVGEPSALMFAPQKGATYAMLPILAERLRDVQRRYGRGRISPWDGAGGGLGFAIASAISARCYDGAQYVLDSMDIPWDDIDLVLTGEGRIDAQTSQGKVVDTVGRAARARGIRCVAVGGCVDEGLEGADVVSTMAFFPELPLTPQTTARRLTCCVRTVCNPKDTASPE